MNDNRVSPFEPDWSVMNQYFVSPTCPEVLRDAVEGMGMKVVVCEDVMNESHSHTATQFGQTDEQIKHMWCGIFAVGGGGLFLLSLAAEWLFGIEVGL